MASVTRKSCTHSSRGWTILYQVITSVIEHHIQENKPINAEKDENGKEYVVVQRIKKYLSKQMPTVKEMVKRIKYRRQFYKLRSKMRGFQIAQHFAKLKEWKNKRRIVRGTNVSDISRICRINPSQRTKKEIEYLLNWIESKISTNGVIQNLFRRCDHKTKLNFVSCLKYRFYNHRSSLVYQNDIAEEFFILISGSVSIHVNKELQNNDIIADFDTKGTKVATLPFGFAFGEAALNKRNASRQASILAEEDCEVLVATNSLFRDIMQQFNAKSKEMCKRFLSDIWAFKGASKEQLDVMGSIFDIARITADEDLLTQNETPQDVYILLDGNCKELLYFQKKRKNHDYNYNNDTIEINTDVSSQQLTKNKNNNKLSAIVISEFSTSKLLGAYEAIKNQSCNTSVITTTTCQVLRTTKDKFNYAISKCPVFKQRIIDQSKLAQELLSHRKNQYVSFISTNNSTLKKTASFAMKGRSYVINPHKTLHRHTRRKRQHIKMEEEYDISELYEKQGPSTVARNNVVPKNVVSQVAESNFSRQKLELDINAINPNVKNEIQVHSSRYKNQLRLKLYKQHKAVIIPSMEEDYNDTKLQLAKEAKKCLTMRFRKTYAHTTKQLNINKRENQSIFTTRITKQKQKPSTPFSRTQIISSKQSSRRNSAPIHYYRSIPSTPSTPYRKYTGTPTFSKSKRFSLPVI